MSGLQILLLVVAIVIVVAVGVAVWIRRRRSGHVLIADSRPDTERSGGRS